MVFRFPGNPKQPYIKRLIGLPKERLRIVGGDIYTSLSGEEAEPTIARKPAERLLSMLQLVHDHRYRPAVFDEVGMPHRWQPWSLEGDAAGDWAGLGEPYPIAKTRLRDWAAVDWRFARARRALPNRKSAPLRLGSGRLAICPG